MRPGVGVYFGLTAIAALLGQLGSGGFIIRHGAIRMSQIALVSTSGGNGGRHPRRRAWLRAVGAGRERHRRCRHPPRARRCSADGPSGDTPRSPSRSPNPRSPRAFCSAAGSARRWPSHWVGAARCSSARQPAASSQCCCNRCAANSTPIRCRPIQSTCPIS